MTQKRPAFTLVELITVIAIITLLIGILVPALSRARSHAKAHVCLTHLKGIGSAFEIYLNENEDVFPPVQLEKVTPSAPTYFVNEYGRRMPRWQWFLETEFGPVIDPVPFQRTGGEFGDEGLRMGNEGLMMAVELFECPMLVEDDFARNVRDGAYGYNYQYLGNTRQDHTKGRWDNFPVRRHRIRTPGATVLAADSRGAGIRHGKHSFTLDPPRLAVEENAMRFGPVIFDEEPFDGLYLPDTIDDAELREALSYSPVAARHNRLANVVFVDGHAEAMTLNELGYELKGGTGPERLPGGTPMPINKPDEGAYHANNQLWNGRNMDQIAEDHKPEHGEPEP
jgi:prepilin-type processing-associated H-X9-DG protein/prepilin-type N-terminal cleavage/methylation domain-containing protein